MLIMYLSEYSMIILNYTADVKTNTKILGTKKSVRISLKKHQQLCQILKICVLTVLIVDFQIVRFIFLNTSLRRKKKIKSHLVKKKIKFLQRIGYLTKNIFLKSFLFQIKFLI